MADGRETWSARTAGRLCGAAYDFSVERELLARARRQASAVGRNDIEFTEADIERMPFDDGEFDLCLCFNGLHCLPDPAAAVREIARCLTPGGRLVGDLHHWLTEAGLRVDRLRRSGGLVHFSATRD